MPVVTHYQIIESTPAGNGTNYVRLRFTLDTGDVLDDGVRFIAADADLAAHAAIIGPRLLDAAIQQEIEQWL